jgi:hypothetical protein
MTGSQLVPERVALVSWQAARSVPAAGASVRAGPWVCLPCSACSSCSLTCSRCTFPESPNFATAQSNCCAWVLRISSLSLRVQEACRSELLQDGVPNLGPHDLHGAKHGRLKFSVPLLPIRDAGAPFGHLCGQQLDLLRGQVLQKQTKAHPTFEDRSPSCVVTSPCR